MNGPLIYEKGLRHGDREMPDSRSLDAYMRIPSLSNPTPSPDGDRIAVLQTNTDESSLRIIDLAKETDAWELNTGAIESPPLWNPCREQLYYQTSTSEGVAIRSVDPRGDSRHLATHNGTCALQDISPDGQFLYYAVDDTVWRYDIDERDAKRVMTETTLVPGPEYFAMSGSLFCSPDGSRLVYTVAVGGHSEGFHPRGQIRLSQADGADSRSLRIDTDPIDGASDALVVRGWHPDEERLLLCDHPFSGHCGIYNLTEDYVEWFGTDLDTSGIPFSGREVPLTFSPNGERFLAWRLEGTDKRLAVYDLDQGVQLFDLGGIIGRDDNQRVGFLSDNRIALVRETETEPGALISVDVSSGATELLSEADYGNIDLEQIVSPDVVRYTTASGATATGVLYQSGNEPSPAIVEVYSGYGSESGWPQDFKRHVQYLVAEGYTVFQPVNPAQPFTGASHEHTAAAGAWLKNRKQVDGDRVAVYGFSLGGYDAVIQALRYPETWAGCISGDGFLNLFDADDQHGGLTELRRTLGDPAENEDEWRAQNPSDELERIEERSRCPLMIWATSHSPQEPFQQFREKLLAYGWHEGENFQSTYLPNQDHVPETARERIERWHPIVAFLHTHLKSK